MSKKRIILMLVVAALVVEIWWLAPYLRKPRRRPDRNRYHPKVQACYQARTANGGATDASSEAYCAASCF